MCLLVLAWRAHPRFRLIVAANRDEYHARPTAPMAVWKEAPDILAGRDLSAQGTWLAVDRQRRFGIVTNFRDVQAKRPDAPQSRGPDPRLAAAGYGARGVSGADRTQRPDLRRLQSAAQ